MLGTQDGAGQIRQTGRRSCRIGRPAGTAASTATVWHVQQVRQQSPAYV